MALLVFDLLPVFVAGQEKVDSEYAAIEWDARVSKETVSHGEQFYATFDMISTIKKTPGAPQYILSLIGQLPSRAVLSYDVIARNEGDGNEISLGSFKISKSLPALKEGARIEFHDEKIPSEGYLEFPPEAESGKYALYAKFTRIEAAVSIFHKDITGMVKDYLPPGAFDSGIKLAAIELIETPPSDITPPSVIRVSPFDGESDIPVDTCVSVSFSEAVEKSSAEAAFSISPSVRGKFTWVENVMTFTPVKKLSHGTLYKVTIGTMVRDLTNTPLATAFEGSFATESKPYRWWIVWPGIIGIGVASLLVCLIIRQRRSARL
ncbi:MAG: Ig-like domain-containing protein [Dehalococcoidia bacterium]